jgi:sensor histidine kinase YesM
MSSRAQARGYRVLSRRSAWLIGFAAFTLIALLKFGYRYFDDLARDRGGTFSLRLMEEMTGVYSAAIIFPALLWFTRRLRFRGHNWPVILAAHCGGLVAFSVIDTTLMAVSRAVLSPTLGLGPYDYGELRFRYPMEFFNHVLAYVSLVAGIYLVEYYREARDRQVQSAELETRLAHAQLQNLRLQLNPHFLFNTLNTISSVMYEDVGRADAMLARLSDLLRHTLEQGDSQQVPLEEEMKLLHLYLEIMQARFGEDLKVNVEVEGELGKALVPQMILQPVVENSIRYGMNAGSSKREVDVRAGRENGMLLLQVRDHGSGIAGLERGGWRKGVGLSNTADRLEGLYGAQHELRLENASGGGLAVTLRLPYRTAAAN